MANRWLARAYPASAVPFEFDVFPPQLVSLVSVLSSKDSSRIALLSPAEKYDIVANGGKLPAATLLQSIQRIFDAYSADKNVQDVISQRKENASKMKVAEEKVKALTTDGELLFEKCGEVFEFESPSSVKPECVDAKSRMSRIEDTLQAARDEFGTQQRTATLLESELQKVARPHIEAMRQELAELGKTWPMLADAWEQWTQYAGVFKGEWTWMGHCHGWALASYMEKAPRRAVVVKVGEKEVLFTEGDIRGLLTKIWADNAPQSLFAGNRCNSAKMATDRRGRILDGKICYNAKGEACLGNPSAKTVFIRNSANGLYEFTESFYETKNKYAIVTARLPNDVVRTNVYESLEEANARSAKFVPALMHVTTACRDTNPATFHVSMVELIAKQKTGFVLDQTRFDQVWNQPAFGYEFTYLPILKKDGNFSVGDELVAIKDVLDPFVKYRAPGTEYLVQVEVNLQYGSEYGPALKYVPNADAYNDAKYVYTLELNAEKKIIGGEWGPVPLPGAENANSWRFRNLIGGDSPDFLWRQAANAKPFDAKLRYSIIKKIHNCSLDETRLSKRTIGNLPELEVAECPM
jgi:hypothetical protein